MLKAVSWFATVTAISAGSLGWAIAQPGFAQTYNGSQPANAIEDLQNPGGSTDPFNNRSGNPSKGVMDLIHNAILGPTRSLDEYGAEQQGNLNSEASDYLKRRQAELKRQAQGDSATGATQRIRIVPASETPSTQEAPKPSTEVSTPTSQGAATPATN
jgi:hypothetical protein